MTQQTEREKFEAWAHKNAIRTDLGSWDAWQARAALEAKQEVQRHATSGAAPDIGAATPDVTEVRLPEPDAWRYTDALGLDIPEHVAAYNTRWTSRWPPGMLTCADCGTPEICHCSCPDSPMCYLPGTPERAAAIAAAKQNGRL